MKLRPIIYGGGQQRDFRSGTENVPGIAGLGMAAKLIYTNHAEKIEKIRQVKDTFLTGVRKLDGVVDNSGEAPHIASVSFRGIERSEVLLHALEAKGVYCSSGSACSSNHPAISGTLKAIGVEDELLNATLRFKRRRSRVCRAGTGRGTAEATGVCETLGIRDTSGICEASVISEEKR